MSTLINILNTVTEDFNTTTVSNIFCVTQISIKLVSMINKMSCQNPVNKFPMDICNIFVKLCGTL